MTTLNKQQLIEAVNTQLALLDTTKNYRDNLNGYVVDYTNRKIIRKDVEHFNIMPRYAKKVLEDILVLANLDRIEDANWLLSIPREKALKQSKETKPARPKLATSVIEADTTTSEVVKVKMASKKKVATPIAKKAKAASTKVSKAVMNEIIID